MCGEEQGAEVEAGLEVEAGVGGIGTGGGFEEQGGDGACRPGAIQQHLVPQMKPRIERPTPHMGEAIVRLEHHTGRYAVTMRTQDIRHALAPHPADGQRLHLARPQRNESIAETNLNPI